MDNHVLKHHGLPENTGKILTAAFFRRDTLSVARDLLGRRLVRRDEETNRIIPCQIVETEAYTANDPACHAYGGRRGGRAETLYKAPGLAYVYLIYGMYHCLNVVTEPENVAGAVLFRAVEPILSEDEPLKTHGPGRLCKALDITRDFHNEIDLTSADSPLSLWEGEAVPDRRVAQTTRIGITKAADYPWRFYIADSAYVSVKDKKKR